MKNTVQIGLKTTIEIHCETGDEILAHLSAIRKTLKKQLKKSGGDIPDGLDVKFEDDNCYGYHFVEIDPEFA